MIIDMTEWSGLFTNADPEDIPKEALQVCTDFLPVNGKLVKTHGFGVKINVAIDV